MRRAGERFAEEQRHAITEAVRGAETSTAAEIVPVVATSSGRYDRAEDTAGVFLGLLLLAGVWWGFQGVDPEGGDWGLSAARFELPAMVAAFLVGFVLGAAATAHVGVLGRLFTPRAQMEAEVAARARAVFFDRRVHHTAGRGGVLLYLSLHERMACVLGDDGILERLGQQALDEVCGVLVAGMREGDPTLALGNAIREAGRHLARVLPRETSDQNEIDDALVTLDEL
jgi:putative membrane protein